MIKLCKKCDTEKPLSEFHNDTQRKDGKYPNCKECHYFYMRNRYATQPGLKEQRIANYKDRLISDPMFRLVAKQRSLKHYSSLKGRATSLLRNARRSPDGCSLTLEWIIHRIEQGICPITRIAFDLTNEHQKVTGRVKNPYSPSLDRIDPKGSYSPENTRIVIWQYNMMKGELSDSEIFYLCSLIASNNMRTAA